MKEFPCNLEGDKRFTRPRGKGEKNAVLPFGDTVQHALNGDVLIITPRMRAALVFICDPGKSVVPFVRLRGFTILGMYTLPEFLGRRIATNFAFVGGVIGSALLPRLTWGSIDLVDALSIRGICKADTKFGCVRLSLPESLGQRFAPSLGLDDSEFGVAIFEDIVGNEGPGATVAPLDPTGVM